jgi:hypothetical protein
VTNDLAATSANKTITVDDHSKEGHHVAISNCSNTHNSSPIDDTQEIVRKASDVNKVGEDTNTATTTDKLPVKTITQAIIRQD